MSDWFRNTSWTPQIRDDFWRRLRAARRSGRVQYLRIQAQHLFATGEPQLIAEAIALLDALETEPPDPVQAPMALQLRGRCYEARGEYDAALDAYSSACSAQRGLSLDTGAHLDFGMLVVVRGPVFRLQEAGALCEEFGSANPFPVEQFRYHAIMAMVAESRGAPSHAALHAASALGAASASSSPIRTHRQLGLVSSVPAGLAGRLRSLSATTSGPDGVADTGHGDHQ